MSQICSENWFEILSQTVSQILCQILIHIASNIRVFNDHAWLTFTPTVESRGFYCRAHRCPRNNPCPHWFARCRRLQRSRVTAWLVKTDGSRLLHSRSRVNRTPTISLNGLRLQRYHQRTKCARSDYQKKKSLTWTVSWVTSSSLSFQSSPRPKNLFSQKRASRGPFFHWGYLLEFREFCEDLIRSLEFCGNWWTF